MYDFLKDLEELCEEHQVTLNIIDQGDDEDLNNHKKITYWLSTEFLKKVVFK